MGAATGEWRPCPGPGSRATFSLRHMEVGCVVPERERDFMISPKGLDPRHTLGHQGGPHVGTTDEGY